MRDPRSNKRAHEVILSHPVITSELIGMEITRGALHLQFSPGIALCDRKEIARNLFQGFIRKDTGVIVSRRALHAIIFVHA